MPQGIAYTDEELKSLTQKIENYPVGTNIGDIASQLGVSKRTVSRIKATAEKRGLRKRPSLLDKFEKPFVVQELPSEKLDIKELIERRKKEFLRKDIAKKARKLIKIDVKIDGPIAIMHMGDPHVDDPGCDFGLIEKHINVVNKTEGMFAANVGDMQNAWIGRLARLYAEQETTAVQAWQLVEWLISSTQWLYLLKGNHDLWVGSGDPLDWMVKGSGSGPLEPHGARLELNFPNGRTCRINARHDFSGHSMWNTTHGPAKAAMMGWRDSILVCGHKHCSGYQVLKDPANGLISHVIRAAGYKVHDRYAEELGLPDQNIFSAPATIIDPEYHPDDVRFVTTIFDPLEAEEFLNFKRKKWTKSK